MQGLLSSTILSFIHQLPDPAAAESFAVRLLEEQPPRAPGWVQDEPFFSSLLTLAAYSPWLAESMLQQPDYIDWLKRERDLQSIKGKEQLLEELARFAARQSSLSEQVMLARFKRRELLRIYLRDCLRLATLTETTEELSSLADTLLQYAFNLCYQRLTNQHGLPLFTDARGRSATAELSVVALGKLGSRELNYASDIDLIFLYSHEGTTAGNGRTAASKITNREFFIKLAEQIVKLIGQTAGEGAVYRIDLRLRPHGRIGLLAHSLAEAVRYYQTEAQPWERQALIKARAAAGSESLIPQFLTAVTPVIFPADPSAEVMKEVRRAKDKIDQHYSKKGATSPYNVKLGRGGIREIEFIVQALQLAHGGRETWLRVPQTLIGLQRLADKDLISDREYTQLADAYTFLRTVEHRLQMEHGVQTHSLPMSKAAQQILARRLGFDQADDPASFFLAALEQHRQHVTLSFERVFSEPSAPTVAAEPPAPPPAESLQPLAAPMLNSAAVTDIAQESLTDTVDDLTAAGLPDISAERLFRGLTRARNPVRALKSLEAFATSLVTYLNDGRRLYLAPEQLEGLIIVLGAGQFFAQMLINNPLLAAEIPARPERLELLDVQTMPQVVARYRRALNQGAGHPSDAESSQSPSVAASPPSLTDLMAQHRRVWHQEILKIGCADVIAGSRLATLNRAQSALALAVIEEAVALGQQELLQRYQLAEPPAAFAILGLGRIAHWGMDYGSDLDLVFVYDETPPRQPVAALSAQQYFTELAELIVQILSVMMREGYLYQVDLRLRPNGSKGMLAQGAQAVVNYLQHQAATWEHLAYLRVRHVAGEASFGRQVQDQIVQACLRRSAPIAELAEGVRVIRDRLIREHVRRAKEANVRWGRGAMMDVYFLTRFLQLKHQIPNPAEPGTLALIEHLNTTGILAREVGDRLYDGYQFLRCIDHALRLLFERPTRTLPQSQAILAEIAQSLDYADAESFKQEYAATTSAIAELFDKLIQ